MNTATLYQAIRGQKNSSALFALLAILLGFVILLWALQLIMNIRHLTGLHQTGGNEQYLIINKVINTAMMSRTEESTFSSKEMNELEKLGAVKSMTPMTSNRFPILAHSMGELGFSTQLFFESLPASYLDTDTSTWHWAKGQHRLPVVLSADFLNLYNFGFALSQGLPQLSEESVQALNFEVSIGNSYRQETFQAEVVGFTQRYSSILVPEAFMHYANETFGLPGPDRVSRLVLHTLHPDDPELSRYLKSHQYTTAQDKIKGSKMVDIASLTFAALSLMGLFLLCLSYALQSMYLQWRLAKDASKLRIIFELGYPVATLRKAYLKSWIQKLPWITLLVLGSLFAFQYGIQQLVRPFGLHLPTLPHPLVFILFLILMLVFFVFLSRKTERSILSYL